MNTIQTKNPKHSTPETLIFLPLTAFGAPPVHAVLNLFVLHIAFDYILTAAAVAAHYYVNLLRQHIACYSSQNHSNSFVAASAFAFVAAIVTVVTVLNDYYFDLN